MIANLKCVQMNSFVIISIIGLIVGEVSADYMQDSWEEPNAWGKHSPSDSVPNICPACDAPEDGKLAAIYYKKLAANLFNKNTLQKNEYSGLLERTILFTVSSAQLGVIEKSTDIRDLDAAITEILKAAKIIKGDCVRVENGSVSWLLKDILKDGSKIVQLLYGIPEIRFIFFIIGILMLIWFIHKRYNKNLIAVVAVGFFLCGYLCTYLECNNKLEADKLIAFVTESEEPENGWIRKTFNSLFKPSEKDELKLKIKAKSKVNLPFCRPDTVLFMYINEMFIQQIEIIIGKCISMIMTFKDAMTFPYNIIAMVSVPILFAFITKLVFKYLISPRVWFNFFWAEKQTGSRQSQQQQSQINSNEDRITGANLQLLLQAFAKHNLKKEPLPSGVEEVMEFLENGSADSKCEESKNEGDDEGGIDLNKIQQEKIKKDS